MDKLRLPEQTPMSEDVVRLLDRKTVLEQDVADSVDRTLTGFEKEYARLIKAANKKPK